jgi:2-phosphosulfolactate phosphatase
MSRDLTVHLLPGLFAPEELRGSVAVMIDVLRASTTIVHALAAGAKAVIPCQEVDEAHRIAANHSAGECLLGGERDGVLIDGFDLDNSPLRYTAEVVGGKTIVFTTTNGTRALERSRQAERVLVGALVNLRAIVDALADEPRPVHLVCAGTRGAVAAEDVLCAGAVADGLQTQSKNALAQNDETRIAIQYYRGHADHRDARPMNSKLYRAISDGVGGRNVRQGGFEADIRRAAEVNLFDIVPIYDPESGTICAPVC